MTEQDRSYGKCEKRGELQAANKAPQWEHDTSMTVREAFSDHQVPCCRRRKAACLANKAPKRDVFCPTPKQPILKETRCPRRGNLEEVREEGGRRKEEGGSTDQNSCDCDLLGSVKG